ncbi:MAG: ribonucleotide reductase N-terminal alpha domain-containing protein, partial [Pseudomonadota bacterium]
MSASEAVSVSKTTARRGKPKGQTPELRVVKGVEIDASRDALLTEFGKKTLEDRYLLPGESFQDMFARVSTAYADDADHAQRL